MILSTYTRGPSMHIRQQRYLCTYTSMGPLVYTNQLNLFHNLGEVILESRNCRIHLGIFVIHVVKAWSHSVTCSSVQTSSSPISKSSQSAFHFLHEASIIWFEQPRESMHQKAPLFSSKSKEQPYLFDQLAFF